MNKRAFIVGAASGMGLAAARELHARGYDLVLADVSSERLAPVANDLGAERMSLDVTDRDGLAAIADKCGPVDALVITAGLGPSMGDFARIIEVNLMGSAATIDAMTPCLRGGSAIICLSSMTAHTAPVSDPAILALIDDPFQVDLAKALSAQIGQEAALPGMAYALSKAGVLRLVQRLCSPLGAKGLRICSISPGCIDTPMGALEMGRSETSREALLSAPIPRSGTSEEVAKAIAFLVSQDASYITGCDLLVDGGWVGALKAGGSDSPLGQALQKARAKS